VAECTRLILVKEGFGGDLGALDRMVDKRWKDIRILGWFGPPERNTLRPLECCIDCVSLRLTLSLRREVGPPFLTGARSLS
jgi:hypothetical protein